MPVRGANQFRELAERLYSSDRYDWTAEQFTKAIKESTVLLREEIIASALNTLPKRGGLAALVAGSEISQTMRRSGKRAGVTIRAKNKNHINSMDLGFVRHPLFGNRNKWYREAVNPGWWTKPTQASAPRVRAEIEAAMEIVKQRIEGV